LEVLQDFHRILILLGFPRAPTECREDFYGTVITHSGHVVFRNVPVAFPLVPVVLVVWARAWRECTFAFRSYCELGILFFWCVPANHQPAAFSDPSLPRPYPLGYPGWPHGGRQRARAWPQGPWRRRRLSAAPRGSCRASSASFPSSSPPIGPLGALLSRVALSVVCLMKQFSLVQPGKMRHHFVKSRLFVVISYNF